MTENYCGLDLRKRRVEDGTVLALHHGKIVNRQRFRPQTYNEADPLPEPRGIQERDSCLSRLALIAAAL